MWGADACHHRISALSLQAKEDVNRLEQLMRDRATLEFGSALVRPRHLQLKCMMLVVHANVNLPNLCNSG